MPSALTPELIPHLFRREYGKLVSTLCRYTGLDDIASAEDIASETFIAALESWPYRGLPPNPVAWLHRVAGNKMINYLQRKQRGKQIIQASQYALPDSEEPEPGIWATSIRDSQLSMFFTICHPDLAPASSAGLALQVICGFSTDEIASLFLSEQSAIRKRLYRARQWLGQQSLSFDLTESAITKRLPDVLRIIYLLFTEGYHSATHQETIRQELCEEAIYLGGVLCADKRTANPELHALMALMCLQASRIPARKAGPDYALLYEEQDRKLWDQALIAQGVLYFRQSAGSPALTAYHLEAAIACQYAVAEAGALQWKELLQLYDWLLQVQPGPVVALNRLYALSKVSGKETAIRAAEQAALPADQYYHTLMGYLYEDKNKSTAIGHWREAILRVKVASERLRLEQKIQQALDSR
ncbi:MAG TPA: DUF6596 domain-containing protein [Sediminibacterium sp.]|nr:DUF6596 domain-containing protein [Sediminibacterium sp.]